MSLKDNLGSLSKSPLCYWEVVEPSGGGAECKEVRSSGGMFLKGYSRVQNGTLAHSHLFLLRGWHEINRPPPPCAPAVMNFATWTPSNRAKQPWTETSEIMKQSKVFLFLN